MEFEIVAQAKTSDPISVGGIATPTLAELCIGSGTTIELSGQIGDIVKWQMSIDEGTNWSDIESTQLVLSTGNLTQTTQFRAIVQNGESEAALSSVAIVIVDAASAGGIAGADALTLCSGSGTSIRLIGHSGEILKWQVSLNGENWSDIADTNTSLSTGPLTQTTRFRAVVKSGVCEVAYSSEAEVNVDLLGATASFTAIVCRGGNSTVTVSAIGGTPPYDGTGQFNAPAGSHSYTVTDANGCTATANVNIPDQIAPPLVACAGSDKEIYLGTSTIIGGSPTAFGGVPNYTYSWTPTTGLNDPRLANCSASPPVTTTYTVSVTDSNGCMASASMTVVVGPAPPHEPLGPSSRKTSLVFSEIMYKPAPRSDNYNLEFIELYNSNPWFEDIGGYRIVADSMSYVFPAGTILAGDTFLVIAPSPSSIEAVYGITNVVGPYVGSLKKSGTLQLLDEQGAVLLTVPYSNIYPWPVAALGTGHSIVLANPTYGEGDPRAWAISDLVNGSPGKIDTFHPSPLRDVVINELLAHSENEDLHQFVELYNHSAQTIDLSGCIITDDPAINRFIIPDTTSISPGGFASFSESELGFRLNGGGGTIYFINPDRSRILDAMQFDAQTDGVSIGRSPDAADGLYPLVSPTPGTNNSAVLLGDIVINELMYHPISDNDDEQYIELFNCGTNIVDLANWKFTAGVNFTFPGNVTLAPNSYLVIARNMSNLFTKYPNLNAGNTVGNYTGKLSHKGERVALARPQTITEINSEGAPVTNIIYAVEDEVTYGTGGRWGQWADGRGSSLELINPHSNHRLAANWADSDDTRKSEWVTVESTGLLDNGQNYEPWIAHGQIGLLDVGECLVDDIEVRDQTGGPNLVINPDFETDLANWSLLGDHDRSSLESPGYESTSALHLRASDQMWTGVNSCQFALNTNTLAEGHTATLRYKARWLRGWPEVLMRLNGNWLEAPGALPVPPNLGTPGELNSAFVTNAGPVIYEVHHAPSIPAAGEAVVITARAHNLDGVTSVVLNYRLDPEATYTAVTMKDDGTDGDAISADGVFSATIPGQSSNSMVAFYITATDIEGVATRFPAVLKDNSPVRECVVMFGDPNPVGSFGVYHLWVTKTNATRWTQLLFLSNEPHDCTVVVGNRVIYNAQGQFQGSPAKQDSSNTPDGALCNYKWSFPDDDSFLGATAINPLHQPGNVPGDDSSLQREQTANLFLRALGVPSLHRRFVTVYVNGNRRGLLMEDAQRPGKDLIEEYFPNDPDGWLYKMQAWSEFAAEPNSENWVDYVNHWCNMMPYTTADGVKKTARYRWTFLVRRTPDSANNFSNVFSMVDAANSYGTPEYVDNMERMADMENWMRVFAANHAAGNFDSYGAVNSQNMYGYIGPQGTKYTLLNYDFNIVLGGQWYSWGPGEHLFDTNPEDPNTAKIYLEPTFRRMYWRALKELVNGPLNLDNLGPFLDAKYKAFLANGLAVENPDSAIKPWIRAARTSIAAQIAAEDTTNFNARLSILVSNDFALVSGTAPVDVKSILFNGVELPVTWTSVTNWTTRVPLQPGTNSFSVTGTGMHGQTITGATDNISIVNEHEVPTLARGVVISEIMYNPVLPGAEFVELLNTSGTLTCDLSGYEFQGLAYTFPPGSMMAPGTFLVLAANLSVFATAYGANISVFDTFEGGLPKAGGTLSLIDTNGQIVTRVRYQDHAPWPTGADGSWESLQLVNPLEDNWRAGNWKAVDSNEDSAQWSYYTVTGMSSSSTLYIYPLGPGDIYIDDLKLVNGTEPEIGPNLLAGGDFETGFPGSWVVPDNLIASCLSTKVKHSGNSSLHIVASAGGNTRGDVIYQNISPTLPYNRPFTLSFWCLPSANPTIGGLVIRLSGSGIATNVNPLPPAPSLSLFTPGSTNSVADASTAFPPLWLNELQADNLTGITNSAGQKTPWLELYNPSTNTVSLNGLWLANNYSNLAEWPFPANATINPGEFKVIFADSLPGLSTDYELHANFSLASRSGSLALSREHNGQLLVVDFIDYTNLPLNYSYGSYPNGQSFDRRPFINATPWNLNTVISQPPLSFIAYDYKGQVYTQNFDTLPNPGVQSVNSGNPVTINGITYSLANPFGFASAISPSGNTGGLGIESLAGWYGMADPVSSVGSRFGATYGDQTTGGIISFGLPNSNNRALGLLATSSTGFTAFGAKLINRTGQTLKFMTLQVTGEVWRQSNLAKSLLFYYLVEPTSTAGFSTNHTALVPQLSVNFPIVPADVGGIAVDGTSSVNQTNLGVVNQLIDWPPDAALWLVWEMVDPAGKAQGLGIDNFTFAASDYPIATPVSLTISQDANQFNFTWPTMVGQLYQLEYNADLATTNWISLGNPIDGTGKVLTFSDSLTNSNRFFRLRLILP